MFEIKSGLQKFELHLFACCWLNSPTSNFATGVKNKMIQVTQNLMTVSWSALYITSPNAVITEEHDITYSWWPHLWTY